MIDDIDYLLTWPYGQFYYFLALQSARECVQKKNVGKCLVLQVLIPFLFTDIEDVEEEESPTITPPTKHTRSSIGSDADPGTEEADVLRSLSMTSAVSTPVLTGPQEHGLPTASRASGTSENSQGRPQALTSIEAIDETSRSSSCQHQNLNIQLPLLKDQGETVQGSSITDYQEKDDQKLQDQTSSNMSRMVKNSSFSTLSSWSSTASVATRTNTDNPASMSHIVTNFNITKSAKQANQANQVAAPNAAEGMASSTTDQVPAPGTRNNSTTTTPANSSSSSSTLTTTHTRSSGGMTSSLPSQAPSEAVTRTRRRTRQSNQAPDSDDDKEYTPMKVFKQTPV